MTPLSAQLIADQFGLLLPTVKPCVMLRELVQKFQIHRRWLLSKNLPPFVRDSKEAISRVLDQAGVLEVGSAPTHAVGQTRLVPTRQEFFLVGGRKREMASNMGDHAGQLVLLAVGRELEKRKKHALKIWNCHSRFGVKILDLPQSC